MVHIWLRAETKLNEKRSALTPSIAKELLDEGTSLVSILGFQITVERCPQRIFEDKEFEE
jgi:saccharopine dehydrogenase (NAD+, L-lysine-forming)